MIWYFLPVSFGKFVAFPLEILFFLCGHEKNNFPRLLTCNTVENGVPIDESGVQQQHSSLEREREKPKNVAHDPLWLTIQFSFRRQDRSSSSALSTAKSTGGTILEIHPPYPIVVARLQCASPPNQEREKIRLMAEISIVIAILVSHLVGSAPFFLILYWVLPFFQFEANGSQLVSVPSSRHTKRLVGRRWTRALTP
jgi:hypothetical protein